MPTWGYVLLIAYYVGCAWFIKVTIYDTSKDD